MGGAIRQMLEGLRTCLGLQAALVGNEGQALQLWAELRSRDLAPDMHTLNTLLRWVHMGFTVMG